MYEKALEPLEKLQEIERQRSSGVRFWQKLFWFFSLKGFAWKMANCCEEAIRVIKSKSWKVVEVNNKLHYMLGEYSVVARLRGSSANEMYPVEVQILKEILLKM